MNCRAIRESLPPESISAASNSDPDDDEPLTPTGRMFLQPQLDTIIHCAIGMKNRLDVAAIKEILRNSLLLKHPRFSSLLVRDKRGRERWRRTDVELDRHVFTVDATERLRLDSGGTPERTVNDYLADLSVSEPLSLDKPLWEVHLLPAEQCAVLRIHHALGDGISLMSMLLADCRKAGDPNAIPALQTTARTDGGRLRRSWTATVAELLRMVIYSVVFCLEFVLRVVCVRDRRTGISGGAGVELWPRKLATAKFFVEDMKTVKAAVANATINDVLFGVIASGLSRYLDHRTPNAMKKGQQITGIAMVNLRPQPGLQELSEMMKSNSGAKWGNRFGILLLPVFYYPEGGGGRSSPLESVKRAKKMIDRKKKSLEAHFSYKLCDIIMSLFGPKVTCLCNYNTMCNTTFTISNVLGPKEEITIAGNPVTYLRVNTSSLPHALTMHMVSYAGRADMQILAAKDVIPDPEFLAKCFEDCLTEMKIAAAAAVASAAGSAS